MTEKDFFYWLQGYLMHKDNLGKNELGFIYQQISRVVDNQRNNNGTTTNTQE